MASRDQSNFTAVPKAQHGPVVLIVSPYAGQANRGPAPSDLLDRAGIPIALQLDVRDLDPEDPQGSLWLKKGYTAAVAAGGDGTIGCVANQVTDSKLPLGILPLGTSNDVARALGVPLDLTAAAWAIRTGVISEVDAGQASLLAEKGECNQSAYFVHAATLGLNTEFARLATDVARRQQWGGLNYATAAVEALLHMQAVPIKIDFFGIPGRPSLEPPGEQQRREPAYSIQADVMQLAVVNTPIFGGRMNLQLPLSHPRDHLLDFVIIEALDPSHMLEMLERLVSLVEHDYAREHRPLAPESEDDKRAETAVANLLLPGIWQVQAQSACIQTETPVEVTLDGELGLQTPIEIRVADEPLRILLPRPGTLGPDLG
jgi:diacylglycerol kinase family enzyme